MGKHIINFLDHKFNYNNFDAFNYESYLIKLIDIGVKGVLHKARGATSKHQNKNLDQMINICDDMGLNFFIYTGIFGSENIKQNSNLLKWSQRDKQGNVLGYKSYSRTSTMFCPKSSYVELVLSQLERKISKKVKGIFFDIPLIMKQGCYCNNCGGNYSSKGLLVREGLKKVSNHFRNNNPELILSINSGAPGIYNHDSSGNHIIFQKDLFDNYVTEWNPLRWNSSVNQISKCIGFAKQYVRGNFYHATTLTNSGGKLYSTKQLTSIFKEILLSGANPWLGMGFKETSLEKIGVAWKKAKSFSS